MPTLVRDLFDEKQTASFLGVSTGTLRVWRSIKRFKDLPYIKVGSAVRYRYEDLLRFVASRVQTGSKPKARRRKVRR